MEFIHLNCFIKKAWVLIFLFNIVLTYAENVDTENEIKSIFSFDSGYTMTALKNNGFGFGINYERKLTDFLSIKPGFGQMLFITDITIVTVDLQFYVNYYPLSNGLDKLYIGLGAGCDFAAYQKEFPDDYFISLTPTIGWKWKILPYLMIEPFNGWKFIIYKTKNYENVDKYIIEGFQWGISFKLFINNINKK